MYGDICRRLVNTPTAYIPAGHTRMFFLLHPASMATDGSTTQEEESAACVRERTLVLWGTVYGLSGVMTSRNKYVSRTKSPTRNSDVFLISEWERFHDDRGTDTETSLDNIIMTWRTIIHLICRMTRMMVQCRLSMNGLLLMKKKEASKVDWTGLWHYLWLVALPGVPMIRRNMDWQYLE